MELWLPPQQLGPERGCRRGRPGCMANTQEGGRPPRQGQVPAWRPFMLRPRDPERASSAPPPPLDREVRTVSTEKRTQHGTHPSSAGRYEMHACTHFLVCACAVSGRHPDTGGPRRRDQGPGPGGGGWEGLSPSRFPARARPHYAARRPCPVRAHGQESIQSPSGALLVTSCLLLTQLPGNCPKGSGGPRPDVGSGQSPAP